MEDTILPVEPGFAFECQRCGACCRLDRVLTLDELSYFVNHGLNVGYTITIKKSDKKTLSIYPCKPYGRCKAIMEWPEQQNTHCLIYDTRPSVCRMYPFVMRIYYKRPPTIEEIDQSLRSERQGTLNKRLRPYIYSLDNQRWAFFGYQNSTPPCPGVGKGKKMDKAMIRRFIIENLYLYENSKQLMEETKRILLETLMIWDEERVLKQFRPVMDIYEDDELTVKEYNALPVDIYKLISGVWRMNGPLPTKYKLKDPLK